MLQFWYSVQAQGEHRHRQLSGFIMYYLGCPLWANERWRGQLYPNDCRPADFLAQYSRYFNAVEGNTTFYADPSDATLTRWLVQTPADFRFCLKVPQRISHSFNETSPILLQQWLALLKPLTDRIGFIHLQFPAQQQLKSVELIQHMLQLIRQQHPCAVEVRHPQFFDKKQQEQYLQQLLRQFECERLCLDSRALFSISATSPALLDAQQKKPRLPVHVVALTPQPVFRFIGIDDLAANRPFYQPWLRKMQQWLHEGKTPYAFFHTPDNVQAPLLARQFAADLRQITDVDHPVLQAWPVVSSQIQPRLFE